MSATRFIVAGSLIDGSGGEIRKKVFVAVKNGIITAIEPVRDLPHPADRAAIDDFSHCTIVPALVDCSISLSRSPSVDKKVRISFEDADLTQKTALFARHIHYCHSYGVLGVADSDDNISLSKRYDGGMMKENSIDIRTSGRLCQNKHDDVSGCSEGNDFLKIRYSGNIEDEEPSSPRMSQNLLRDILLQCHNKKKVVVANGQHSVAQALAAGCDAIEQGYCMGEDNIRKMAENQVLWIPSVLRAKNALDSSSTGGDVCCRFSQRYVAPGKPVPGAEVVWKKKLADQLAQLRRARALGVMTAVGTGAGSIGILHGESMVEEMKLFIKAGYSLTETIRCATDQGAQFFGMENLGKLTVGRQATFLITRGTPQQLPRKLAYLESIVIHGTRSAWYQKDPVKTAR